MMALHERMRLILKIVIFFTPAFLFIACNKTPSNRYLAKVGDEYLTVSELAGIIPAGASKKDSMLIVKNYVENWVMQNVLAEEAEKKLPAKEKDFSLQLENYRKSLLVYQFDKTLIDQYLDTVVTEREIMDYYGKNPQEFELKDNIVKVIYVKLLKSSPHISRFKNLIINVEGSQQNRIQLANLAPKLAVNYFLDDQSWLIFNDLLKEVPVKTYNQEQFLQNNRYIEITDNEYIYMMKIEDFKIKESSSPLSFEKENVKKVILQKRKMKLLQQIHLDIYNNALNNKNVEILGKQ